MWQVVHQEDLVCKERYNENIRNQFSSPALFVYHNQNETFDFCQGFFAFGFIRNEINL